MDGWDETVPLSGRSPLLLARKKEKKERKTIRVYDNWLYTVGYMLGWFMTVMMMVVMMMMILYCGVVYWLPVRCLCVDGVLYVRMYVCMCAR